MTSLTSIGASGFAAYVALPPGGTGPLLVMLQEIFGINANVRRICDGFAQEGYVVVAPDLFWRQTPGVEIDPSATDAMEKALSLLNAFDDDLAMKDINDAIDFAFAKYGCHGPTAAVGYCLGGRLALRALFDTSVAASVSYYGVELEGLVSRELPTGKAAILHIAQEDAYCPPANQELIRKASRADLKAFFYPGCDHAFAREGSPHFCSESSRLAYDRTLNFLIPKVGPNYDLESLWEAHLDYEFTTRDAELTMRTMVDEPYVNHIPTMTGGVGYKALYRFYKEFFIGANPADTAQFSVSRTVGARQVVDEVIFSFTHDRRMDWLLPGVKPTGRKVRFGLVGVVRFRGDKICHEHIYWDQASVLAQVGLLKTESLPIVGVEGTDKITDNSIPSNQLISGW